MNLKKEPRTEASRMTGLLKVVILLLILLSMGAMCQQCSIPVVQATLFDNRGTYALLLAIGVITLLLTRRR